MRINTRKEGDEMLMVIPPQVIKEFNIKSDTPVELIISNDGFMVRPMIDRKLKKTDLLSDLFQWEELSEIAVLSGN